MATILLVLVLYNQWAGISSCEVDLKEIKNF